MFGGPGMIVECGWFKRQYFEKAQRQASPPPFLMTKAFKCLSFVWNSSLRTKPQQWRYRVLRFLKEKTKTWEQWQRPPAVPSGLPSLHTPEDLDEQELHTLERSWWWCSCCTACPPAPWRGDGPRPASTLAFEPCARLRSEQRRFLQIKKQKRV